MTEQVGDWEFCTSQYSLPSLSFFIFGRSVLYAWVLLFLLFLLFSSESDSSIDAERFLFVEIFAGREFFLAVCEVRFMIGNQSVSERVMPWEWAVIDRRCNTNRGKTRSETRLSLISREPAPAKLLSCTWPYYTPNHCQTWPPSPPSPRLITSKIIRGISSPFSLSIPRGSYIVAMLCQKLDIGGGLKFIKIPFKIQLPVCDAVSRVLIWRI